MVNRTIKKVTQHISFVPIVSAAGATPIALLIVQGVKPMSRFTEGWPELLLAMDEKGYMTKEIFIAFIIKWEERTRPTDASEYRVLFVDNHYSRFVWDCFLYLDEHKARLVGMHPHTTAALCVLDCGPFRSLKSNFRTLQNKMTRVTTDADIAGLLKGAWDITSNITYDVNTGDPTSVIIRAFEKVGLFPYNRTPLGEEYFEHSDIYKQEGGAADTTKSTTVRPKLTMSPEELAKLKLSILTPAIFTPEQKAALDKAPRTKMAQLFTSPDMIVEEAAKATASAALAAEQAAKPWNIAGISFKAWNKQERKRKEEEATKKKGEKAVAKETKAKEKTAALAAKLAAPKAKDAPGKVKKAVVAPTAAAPALAADPKVDAVPVTLPAKGKGGTKGDAEMKRKRSKEALDVPLTTRRK